MRSLRGGFTAWQRRGNPWCCRLARHATGSRSSSANVMRATCACRKSVRRGSASCSRRACCASAPAGSGRRQACTSPRPASARSASSTTTRSNSATCSARSCTPPGVSGWPRSTSAARTLESLNPGTTIVPIESRLVADNAPDLIAAYDLVIDGSDNLATRYLVNDTALRLGKPVVHGADAEVRGARRAVRPVTPCYRCLFARRRRPELAPSCAEAGVLGVLPGVIGVAAGDRGDEVDPRHRRESARPAADVDALSMRFSELHLLANPQCPRVRECRFEPRHRFSPPCRLLGERRLPAPRCPAPRDRSRRVLCQMATRFGKTAGA